MKIKNKQFIKTGKKLYYKNCDWINRHKKNCLAIAKYYSIEILYSKEQSIQYYTVRKKNLKQRKEIFMQENCNNGRTRI